MCLARMVVLRGTVLGGERQLGFVRIKVYCLLMMAGAGEQSTVLRGTALGGG